MLSVLEYFQELLYLFFTDMYRWCGLIRKLQTCPNKYSFFYVLNSVFFSVKPNLFFGFFHLMIKLQIFSSIWRAILDLYFDWVCRWFGEPFPYKLICNMAIAQFIYNIINKLELYLPHNEDIKLVVKIK